MKQRMNGGRGYLWPVRGTNEDEVLAPATPGAQALPTTGADDVQPEGEAD